MALGGLPGAPDPSRVKKPKNPYVLQGPTERPSQSLPDPRYTVLGTRIHPASGQWGLQCTRAPNRQHQQLRPFIQLYLRTFVILFLSPHPPRGPGEGPDYHFPTEIAGCWADSGPDPGDIYVLCLFWP